MPMPIWEVETEGEKQKHTLVLEVENASRRKEVEHQRARAANLGLKKHPQLVEVNANIERFST